MTMGILGETCRSTESRAYGVVVAVVPPTEPTEARPKQGKAFAMKCRRCGYQYGVFLFEVYEWETCPICGHVDRFWEFCI